MSFNHLSRSQESLNPFNSFQSQNRNFSLSNRIQKQLNQLVLIRSQLKKFEDYFFWLYILGRSPNLNLNNTDFLKLKNLSLLKILPKHITHAKQKYQNLYSYIIQNQKLFHENNYDLLLQNTERMTESLIVLRKQLKISKLQDQLLIIQRQNQPDQVKEKDRNDIIDAQQTLDLKNIDISDHQEKSLSEMNHEERAQYESKQMQIKRYQEKIKLILNDQKRRHQNEQTIETSKQKSETKELAFQKGSEAISSNQESYKRYNPDYDFEILPWTEFKENFEANIRMLEDEQIEAIPLNKEALDTKDNEFVAVSSFENLEISEIHKQSIIYDSDADELTINEQSINVSILVLVSQDKKPIGPQGT